MSNISKEDFDTLLGELIDIGLLIPISPQNKGIEQYLAIPPFNPITNYYANINANLESITHQLHQLIANSLKKIFQDNPVIELNTLYDESLGLRKDLEEDSIIQKQDVEDIVQGMENVNAVKDIVENLGNSIKEITKTQFSSLIKSIASMKKEIFEKIELLELKKSEKDVKYIIDQVFKDQFEKVVGEYSAAMLKKIDEEFKNTLESLKNIINSTLQLRNDMQMLLLNMLNNFENNIKRLIDFVKKKKDNLSGDLDKFEKIIDSNFSNIISKSVESVASLNNPINKAMKNYFKAISSNEKLGISEIININSVSRVNEEIKNAVENAQNNLLIIIPKLDDHLSIDDFNTLPSTLKTQIAASEAHTNSIVKKYKEIKNLDYKTLKNDTVIIINRDDAELFIGIIQHESKDTLQDFIGFSTSFKPLIKLLAPVTGAIWDAASSGLQETPRSIGFESSIKAEQKITKAVKTIAPELKQKIIEEKEKIKKEKMTLETVEEAKEKHIVDFSKTIDFTTKMPINSETSQDIDLAFSSLTQNLQNLNGEEFSQELEKVAEQILEKKGFSVTLHKIRSKINQYKTQMSHLSEVDIAHIIESIEEWKKKLL